MNDTVKLAVTNAAAGLLAGEELATQKAAMQAVIHRVDGGRPFRVLPNGNAENIEGFLPAPAFRRAEVQLHDAVSFIAYVQRFKDPTSLIFADSEHSTFTAVLDYHEAGPEGKARWGRHRVILALRTTTAWDTWVAMNQKQMTQADFARFIEDNLPDIGEPVGAELVEMARALEAKKAVEWLSHFREQDGSHKFTFNETVQGSAASGRIAIPDKFILALKPYEGSDTYKVEARFRYRLQGAALALWFDLYRADDILEEAFLDERHDIGAGVGDATLVLSGPAPAKPGSAD